MDRCLRVRDTKPDKILAAISTAAAPAHLPAPSIMEWQLTPGATIRTQRLGSERTRHRPDNTLEVDNGNEDAHIYPLE
eukprot:6444063-Karenia_brevis.AAC.1